MVELLFNGRGRDIAYWFGLESDGVDGVFIYIGIRRRLR